ncbi:MAG: hypothetical protein ACRDRJ_43040, partial [Streptosporangiaceae bacterium]
MNRSAVREFHAPGVSVPRGELLIPTQVGDPARGPLMCPAGPLIGGSLLRKGWRAAAAPVPVLDDLGGDLGGGAAVYLVTCAQRGGQTAALAAAASPDDRRAAAA